MSDTPHPIDDDLILIELTGTGGGFRRAGIEDSLEAVKHHSQTAMNLAMSTIHATARRVGRTLQDLERDLMPNEVEVEFTIKLELGGSVETGQVTSLIAKADANGNASGQFLVKFKWNMDKPQEARVQVSQ